MENLTDQFLRNNEDWVKEQLDIDPEFFSRLAKGQHPEVLWIGCADSRVPPNMITKTQPGEIFIHRNIANLVNATDMNILSVLQYAVQILKVKHIIVNGHYECGGVIAAMENQRHGLIDNWIRQIADTQNYYWAQLKDLDIKARQKRMVELSVVEQVYNLAKTSIIREAWAEGNTPSIHGWVYDIHTGKLLKQTEMINSMEGVDRICKFARGIVGVHV